MIPMCIEQLSATGTRESEAELQAIVEEFVWRLTGKETIYQMMALAEAVRERGGTPLEARLYKRMYLDRLWMKIRSRIDDLRDGRVPPEHYLVPGSRALLESLVERGVRLYLASGTDHEDVEREAALLGIARYFDGGIFGAREDLQSFSKALLVKQILARAHAAPDELLVFGDGYVEIEEVKKAGGVAVGVATSEPDCDRIDAWKRKRLAEAGADYVVPHYLQLEQLTATLWKTPVLQSI